MFCSECGVRSLGDTLYCHSCGSQQKDKSEQCSGCKTNLIGPVNYCWQCGMPQSELDLSYLDDLNRGGTVPPALASTLKALIKTSFDKA
jgi:hypothetical protein